MMEMVLLKRIQKNLTLALTKTKKIAGLKGS